MADHKLRFRIHSFYTILFKNKKEGTSFLNEGHANAYSNLKSTVNSFLFLNSKSAANYCTCLLKSFDRSNSYALQDFHKHSSKICLAQNG